MYSNHGWATLIQEPVEIDEVSRTSALRAAGRAIATGDLAEAGTCLRKAFDLPLDANPDFPTRALTATETLLKQHEISLAEQLAMIALARCQKGSPSAHDAQMLIAQVHEARWHWEAAADMYGLAREGFLQTCRYEEALGAGRRQAWALIQHGKYEQARSALLLCADIPTALCPSERHICQAMTAYCAFRAGDHGEAQELVGHLHDDGGTSVWADCLTAVTSGWLLLKAGSISDATCWLAEAENLMCLASHESHSTDIINLVGKLRVACSSLVKTGALNQSADR